MEKLKELLSACEEPPQFFLLLAAICCTAGMFSVACSLAHSAYVTSEAMRNGYEQVQEKDKVLWKKK